MTSSTPTSKPERQPPAMAVPMGPKPWWRRWFEPILVVTIIVALFTVLATGGVTMFQSVKGDIRAAETRLSERVDRVNERIEASEMKLREEIQASEARLYKEIQASEVRLHEEIQTNEARQSQRIDKVKAEIKDLRTELKQDNAELKADMKAMDNKLDLVLEALLAPSPEVG